MTTVHQLPDNFDAIDPIETSRDADLIAHAQVIRALGAAVLDCADIGVHAIGYAVHNWAIFPGNGKIPAIPNPHPKGSRERRECNGECGLAGHGVYDATKDVGVVARWWGGQYSGANILGRVPAAMFVLDVDPRNGGDQSLAVLEQRHEPLPETLTTISGRGDGGAHLFYRRPPGKLSAKRLGPGLDVKTSSGYVVLAPSIHPDTGKPYTRIDHPVAAPPVWLIELLAPERRAATPMEPSRSFRRFTGPSVADAFSAAASWAAILARHGWYCLDSDPDADGARWRHPSATAAWSATIRNGCLFVYSTNTPFDVTEPGDVHGYNRFRAYAVLDHNGDLRSAAQALKGWRR